MSYEKTEEVSFGDDREPWSGRWRSSPPPSCRRRGSEAAAGTHDREERLRQVQQDPRLPHREDPPEVFLQDRPFAMRLAKHQRPHLGFTLDRFSETLYVRLDDPAKAKDIGRAVVELPGVGYARLVQ